MEQEKWSRLFKRSLTKIMKTIRKGEGREKLNSPLLYEWDGLSIPNSEVEIKRLKLLSKKTGLSASEILRRAIDDYERRPKGR